MASPRDILLRVPQDPEFHPEGNAWTHTHAVRRCLDEAIALLPEYQISDADRNVLRLAAWCHDLGKARATVLCAGRWIAPGHERSRQLNAGLRELGLRWRTMWRNAATRDRKAFLYACTRHMGVDDRAGIDPAILDAARSPDAEHARWARLVIVLMVMDRLGTARPQRSQDAGIVVAMWRKAQAPSGGR